MELNQADQYYLKALDYYPFNFEFVLENLQYALSYDDKHVQSLCLKGQIFMYYIKEFEEAKLCFIKALERNMLYPDVYKHLSKLYIWLGAYDEAKRLIRYGKKVPGINHFELIRNEALLHECQGDYQLAKSKLRQASLLTHSSDCRERSKEDMARLKEKLKILKRSKKKGKKFSKTQ